MSATFGSEADICSAKTHVRFTPESDTGGATMGAEDCKRYARQILQSA